MVPLITAFCIHGLEIISHKHRPSVRHPWFVGSILSHRMYLPSSIVRLITIDFQAMDGITVKETTFSWHMTNKALHGIYSYEPVFTTGRGKPVGDKTRVVAAVTTSSEEDCIDVSAAKNGSKEGAFLTPNILDPSEPGPVPEVLNVSSTSDCAVDDVIVIAPATTSSVAAPMTSSPDCTLQQPLNELGIEASPPSTSSAISMIAQVPNGTAGSGDVIDVSGSSDGKDSAAGPSPEDIAAQAAAKVSLTIIKQSILKRCGAKKKISASVFSSQASDGNSTGSTKMAISEGENRGSTPICSTPFVNRRSTGSAESSRADESIEVNHTAPDATSTCGQSLPLGRGQADGSRGEQPRGSTETRGDIQRHFVIMESSKQTMQFTRVETVTPPTPEQSGLRTKSENEKRVQVEGTPRGTTATARKRAKIGKDCVRASTAEDISPCGLKAVAHVPKRTTDITPPLLVLPISEPTKLVVKFSSVGSLGIGLEEDENEEGSLVLASKSPTSAAAKVPDRWRVTEANGKSVRRLGGKTRSERSEKRRLKCTVSRLVMMRVAWVASAMFSMFFVHCALIFSAILAQLLLGELV